MATIRLTCPECAKVLRLSARPPAGKKLKCPACGELFVPQLDDDEVTGIQTKPKAPATVARRDDDEDEDEPRKQKSHSRNHADNDDDDAPRKKRRRDEDDDDDDVPIKKKKGKGAKAGKSRVLLIVVLLGLLGGGGLLGCGACGIGAFVWPGFLLSKVEMASFIAPDANIVMGGNLRIIKDKMPNLQRIIRQQEAIANQRPEMDDITLNSERMLAFSSTGAADFEKSLITIYQLSATDMARAKLDPLLGPAQTIGGHSGVHRATDEGKKRGMPALLAFPGSNLLIATNAPEPDLIRALDRGKKPPQPNAALKLGQTLDKSAFWMVVLPTAADLTKVKQEIEKGGPLAPKELAAAGPAVGGIKEITLTFDVGLNEELKLNMTMRCKNGADASNLKRGVEVMRDQLTLGFTMMANMPPQPGLPKLGPTLVRDWRTLNFFTMDAVLHGNMNISSATIEDLARLGAAQKANRPFGP